MAQVTSRDVVSTHVDSSEWTLLLIVDDKEGRGRTIHDRAVKAFRRERIHRKTLLFDAAGLCHPEYPPAEIDREDGRYVVIGRKSRGVIKRGPIDDLLRNNGDPSIQSIRRAFNAGDRA